MVNTDFLKKNIFWQEVYRERKLLVRKTCEKYGLGNFTGHSVSNYKEMETNFPWPPEKSLMYQPTWHLLYCWLHKVLNIIQEVTVAACYKFKNRIIPILKTKRITLDIKIIQLLPLPVLCFSEVKNTKSRKLRALRDALSCSRMLLVMRHRLFCLHVWLFCQYKFRVVPPDLYIIWCDIIQ